MRFHQVIAGCSWILFLLLLFFNNAYSQNKEALEKERMRIIEKIEETSAMLDKTSKDKNSALTELNLIQDQINNRKKVIDNIQQSIEFAEEQLTAENRKQDDLVISFIQLKEDHSSLVRASYLKMMTENKLVYLLSSKDWEESLTRIRYSGMLEEYLQRQIDTIGKTTIKLDNSIQKIETETGQYRLLLEQERSNFEKLELEEKRKDRLLTQLKGDEKRLRGALIKQKRDREELNKAIEKIIFATLHQKENEANAEIVSLTGEFDQNRNKLPWPVDNAKVISKYGKQKHPTLENVFVSNNGIDIFSSKNSTVRAIFRGEVAGSMQIPGNDYMVMIRHGEYYTVYSKMSEIYVSKGDKIRAGHTIGRLGQFNATLHFEIWEGKQKLDPEKWLK